MEKQNDFKQNKSWEKNAKQFFHASMVRKILVIITLFLFEKDSKKKTLKRYTIVLMYLTIQQDSSTYMYCTSITIYKGSGVFYQFRV